jgi:signal transduction histidine kinase
MNVVNNLPLSASEKLQKVNWRKMCSIIRQWVQHNLLYLFVIVGALLFISFLHYSTAPGISQLHAVYRYFYFLPIVFGALQFGYWGGLLTALAATLLFIPHILLRWDIHTLDAFNDLLVVFIFFGVALITGLTIDRLKRLQVEQVQTAAKLALSLEQLQEQGEALRRSERLSSLGTLAGGLAHEIRNPLGIIRACAQLLALEEDESLKETMTVIRQETERIEALIQELLTYAGGGSPQLVATDLCRLLRETEKRLRPLIEAKGIALFMEVPAEAVTLALDSVQIEKMVINLSMNAIQSLDGAGSVKIELHPTAERNSSVRLEIADNGPGIAPEQLSRIFDPFYTTKERGIGLGLSVVQRIVEDHEGQIQVISEVGRGTRFLVDLPRNGL